jgi:hypothetical protein
MLSYLVSLVKLSDAQLPRQFCELFDAQVPRQFLETTRCSTASSNLVKLSDAQLPRQFCELFDAQLPRQFLETTRCSTASSNLVKLSDAEPKEPALPRAHCKDTIIPRMKLQGLVPNSYILVSVSDLYIKFSHNRSAYFAAAE